MLKVALLFSNILLPFNGGIAFFSPSNFIQLLGIFLFKKIKLTNAFVILVLLLSNCITQVFNYDLVEFIKFVIVIGGIVLSLYVNKFLKTRSVFHLLLLYFIFDLILRIYFGNYQQLSIYSIKYSSGISIDPNFIGIMIVVLITARRRIGLKFYSYTNVVLLLLLLSTMSRTAWLFFLLVSISFKYPVLGYVARISTLAGFSYIFFILDIPASIQSSLDTKTFIAQVFVEWFRTGDNILVGLGDEGASRLSQDLGYRGFVSHTLLGLTTVNGLLSSLSYILLSFYAFYRLKDTSFLAQNLLVVGFVGLWPVSMIGNLALIYAIGIKSRMR